MPSRLTRTSGPCWMPRRVYQLRLQQEQKRARERRRRERTGARVSSLGHHSSRGQTTTDAQDIQQLQSNSELTGDAVDDQHQQPQDQQILVLYHPQLDATTTTSQAASRAGHVRQASSSSSPTASSALSAASTRDGRRGSSGTGHQQCQRELMRELVRLSAVKQEMERQVKESQRELERASAFALRVAQTPVHAMEGTRGLAPCQRADHDHRSPTLQSPYVHVVSSALSSSMECLMSLPLPVPTWTQVADASTIEALMATTTTTSIAKKVSKRSDL